MEYYATISPEVGFHFIYKIVHVIYFQSIFYTELNFRLDFIKNCMFYSWTKYSEVRNLNTYLYKIMNIRVYLSLPAEFYKLIPIEHSMLWIF